MKDKLIDGRAIGLVFASTLIIPSNYGFDLFGINLEDLPLVLLFMILFYQKFSNLKISKYDKYFLLFISIVILYSNIFTKNITLFNQTNLRFYFYFLLSYLCVDIIIVNKSDVITIFEQLSFVMVANFLVIIFQLQLPGTIDGWILNNTGSINPLTSGRLGGFQGGGPNVIGILCVIYLLLFIYKISLSDNFISYLVSNRINTILFLISIFNLYITFSRGSYLALFVGSMVILFYTKIINTKQKILLLSITLVVGTIFIFMYPSIFLKQSNRSFLNNLAISNIEIFNGTGGGGYIKEVYKEYLVTLDEDDLLERFNISYTDSEKNIYSSKDSEKINEEVSGFLKLKFDYKDGFLPRSLISFYHSTNGETWSQVGSDHTSGLIIDIIKNDSFFEVGGWADGQSPGESYLDGYIKKIIIKTTDKKFEYFLTNENRDTEYFVYLPKSINFYDNRNDGKIVFTEDGIKLKRPRSYWVAIPNKTDISKKDFEIIIQLKINNIPKGNETLFSQSSIINSSKLVNNQSWKWSIIDGRMYFFWIDDVTSGYSNFVGGQSLRSGKLIVESGEFNSTISNFSLSQYDEITTSHNGFLTMAVEYGLFPIVILIILLFSLIIKNLNNRNQLELAILVALLTQNLTNDLLYSPDVAIYFWIIPILFLANITKD